MPVDRLRRRAGQGRADLARPFHAVGIAGRFRPVCALRVVGAAAAVAAAGAASRRALCPPLPRRVD